MDLGPATFFGTSAAGGAAGATDSSAAGSTRCGRVAMAGAPVETGGAGGLKGRVVIVVEDVDADHRLAAIEQSLGHVHADETGGAGDDDRPLAHAPRPIDA